MLMRSIFPMNHKRSSVIAGIGHNPKTQQLAVLLKSGAVKFYPGIPRETFQAFISADSLGRFYNAHIRRPRKKAA
jgi:hypothetical protein